MNPLKKQVTFQRRFSRSTRLDQDLHGTSSLVGYVLLAGIAHSLTAMARSQAETRQGAFIWTGPYGGGKSSAAVLVANLIGGHSVNMAQAREIVGKDLQALYDRAFPTGAGPWAVVAVTGRRVGLREAIADAAAATLEWSKSTYVQARQSDEELIAHLVHSAMQEHGGIVLILDELGKILEHEAASGGDIHLLQDLAESCARSKGRLVVIGVLHQAFEQYAARVSRDGRQEWAKVEGRFQNIPFLAGSDEAVALLGQAINCEHRSRDTDRQAATVAAAVAKRKPTDEAVLARALARTWPLNPVTALLLGPVSRQRFAQNERSVFGFLGSAEPGGFQEFLTDARSGETYGPDRLWDYLVANFGMTLASGANGNRFSLAFEAIERAGVKGGPLHVRLTKIAAIIEFFRNGSGLSIADDVLMASVPDEKPRAVSSALDDLVEWAVLIHQPRLGGYALFAGSDFELEDAIGRALNVLSAEQLASVPSRVGLGFVAAKRHYFYTGTLRTFEIVLFSIGMEDDVETIATRLAKYKTHGAGLLVLAIGDGMLTPAQTGNRCKRIAQLLKDASVVVAIGAVKDSYALRNGVMEMFAIERVLREHPQLEGDRIARRELAARQAGNIDIVYRELQAALDHACWWIAAGDVPGVTKPLSIIASQLAEAAYPCVPILKSELLQRERPSSSAMAAMRELCYAMVRNPSQEYLGFTGYPAEMGLYITILAAAGLHDAMEDGTFGFLPPDEDTAAGRSLVAAWAVLGDADDAQLDEVYARWARPPFGIKAGIMPVLALAIILARREHSAVYLDGMFQTSLDDIFVDKLLQQPARVRIKAITRDGRKEAFLLDLGQRFGVQGAITSLSVAQAIFQRFEILPVYAQRTGHLSSRARAIRGVVLKANDPEALLFEQLPAAMDNDLDVQVIYDAVVEVENTYPSLLEQLRLALAQALAVDPCTFQGLRERTATIAGLTNDFSFEGFAMRAAAFEGGEGDIEGVASVLLHKPARNWSDRDQEQALVQMARYGQHFRELETLAAVRNRRSNTEALALIVGIDPAMPPVRTSFALTDAEKQAADALAEQLRTTLGAREGHERVHLAALARVVAGLIDMHEDKVAL
ncbi:ATP-binding protein [Novacetimonas pomaceti]|uniref:ATP-binding protein n=1 Tax=Novacetimonas pomaceti TaxID=2021998 RepID=A0A318Q5K0_9PROT|nr:ATP-binding protein [Novacetimonas pomaceti]PYD74806.1 ATP-binding protein [Novacetimonas pomaceti]